MNEAHAANRREDARLVTGSGRFTADWNLPGQLYAGFLRSDRAHAEIVAIDATPALKRRGVVAVFTGADALAAGYKQFPTFVTFTNRDGVALLRPDRPVLAAGKVRFVGDAVAMIVAESALAAQDALDAIEIQYRDLAPVIGVENALAAGAPQLHAGVPGNRCFDWKTGDETAVDRAFAQAAHVTRIKVVSPRVVPSAMEQRACLINYAAATDSYDVYVPAQGITLMRWQFSVLTGVPEDRLRCHARDVGGSFGQRSGVYPEYAAQMMAAKKLGRPIKWVSTRSEGFLSDTHGRGITLAAELALDRGGRFLAARYDFLADMGGYLTATGPASHVRNPTIGMTGVYRIPAIYGRIQLVLTNTVPVAAYRGAGRPDIAYVIERLVDQAAHELGIDRVELRRRNFIPPDAFPYKTPTMGVYEQADFAGCLDKALTAADWSGYAGRREASRRAGKLRGIGLATVIEGTSTGRSPQEQAAIEFDAQGRIALYTVSQSCGQSHETTLTQIVAQTLGIAPQAVTLHASVHTRNLMGNPSGGSRSMVTHGSACYAAAQKLIELARPLAAEELDLEPSQVEYANGGFRARDGGRSIDLLELARKHAGKDPHPLNLVAEITPAVSFPNGCHIAEVEVDPATGATGIVSYTAVDDCGTVINHSVVEGQVHGGVAMGAGQVFGEHAAYDPDSGQLLAGSFSDYCMPRAGWLRDIQLNDRPLPSTSNPLGAKGVGEAGCTASLPALANAVVDALRPLGVERFDLPFTPGRVWQAIHNVKNP